MLQKLTLIALIVLLSCRCLPGAQKLFLQQVWAMLAKRFHTVSQRRVFTGLVSSPGACACWRLFARQAKRDRKVFMWQILYPLLVLIVGIALIKVWHL